MIPPSVHFTEPGSSALVAFDTDSLGCSITSWPGDCLVDVAWRLPVAARVGAIECVGAASWQRNGIWMTAIVAVRQDGSSKLRITRPADLDGDGFVDAADLSVLLGDWGGPEERSDLNLDGNVDAIDQAILMGNWGRSPTLGPQGNAATRSPSETEVVMARTVDEASTVGDTT
jgi:hypothetical protein